MSTPLTHLSLLGLVVLVAAVLLFALKRSPGGNR